MRSCLFFLFGLLLPGFVFAQNGDGVKKVAPAFIQGDEVLEDLLMTNYLNMPSAPVKTCEGGTALISFLVRKDGTIDSFTTLHAVDPRLMQHAFKFLMQTNGHWKPGTINGEPAEMRKILPFLYVSFGEMASKMKLFPYFNLNKRYFARPIAQNGCPDAEALFIEGMKLFKEQQYAEAWAKFDRAYTRDFLHLDALDMLKKTADLTGKECDICKGLQLISKFSTREIKRVREQYCTKDFKTL